MVSVSDGLLSGLGVGDESVQSDVVGQILVQVVLEHLDVEHLLPYEFVLSHSWEGETLVHQFPGSHHWWFLSKFASDCHGLAIVGLIECS